MKSPDCDPVIPIKILWEEENSAPVPGAEGGAPPGAWPGEYPDTGQREEEGEYIRRNVLLLFTNFIQNFYKTV